MRLIDDIKAANENGGMGDVVASTLKRYVKRLPTIGAVPDYGGAFECE